MNKNLTPRLKNVFDSVGECDFLCDVGCDHAYLPISLLKSKKIKKAYACDVRPGPLSAAEKNIRLNGFENEIKTVLSDGLKEVCKEKFNCITVCGMGGILISQILSATQGCEKCAKSADRLVLQPMSELENLRKYLFDNGFTIYDEKLARENERYYTIICAKKGEEKNYDAFDLKFGKFIFSTPSEIVGDKLCYFEKNYDALSKNLKAKKKAGRENTDELLYIVEKLEKIRKIIE